MSLHILFFFSHHFFFTVVFTLFYHAVEYQVHRNQHAVKQNKTIPHLRTDIPLSLLCMFIHVYIDIYIFNTYIYISDYHGLFLLWFIMALLGKLSTDHNKCVFWHFYKCSGCSCRLREHGLGLVVFFMPFCSYLAIQTNKNF